MQEDMVYSAWLLSTEPLQKFFLFPYGTLCGAMTQDIDERAKINTSRSVAAMIAIGVLNIITVPLQQIRQS